MTKTHRLLELMQTVYERRQFTVQELADEFGVSYRTMLRYLQELSGMGVPLYAEPGRQGGYALLPGSGNASAAVRNAPLVRKLFKPASAVIGLETRMPFTAVLLANAAVPQLWDELRSRRSELPPPAAGHGRLVGAVRSRSRIYHYIAGAEFPPDTPVPEGMTAVLLPARAYAVYVHRGAFRREGRDETYFGALERLRGMNADHDPDAYALESFPDGASGGGSDDCEIFIPLK